MIGAGARGRAFALRCAQAGYVVILEDVLSSNLRQAQQILLAEASQARFRVNLVSSVEDAVRDADLAIDFVPDELESKLEIFSLIDRMAPPRTILCTPTTLSIADLASCTYRPDRCIGVVPFGDELGASVGLTYGPATTMPVLHAVQSLFHDLGALSTVHEDTLGSTLVR